MVLGEWRPKYFDIQMVRGESCSIYLVERSSSSNSTIYSIVRGDPCPSAVGRSQRVTTPHCSCGTTQTSRAWGAPPTDSVLEPELDTPQSQVKGGWLLLVCHFLDALQTF